MQHFFIRHSLPLGLLCLLFCPPIFSQKIETPTFNTDTTRRDALAKRWHFNGGIGLDASAISLLNPRVGEGDGRLSAGLQLNAMLNYEGRKYLWNNRAILQWSVLKESDTDWTKAADALLWNSQIGRRLIGRWFVALMADIQTQTLPTYDGRFLSPQTDSSRVSARFFAPATLKLAPGLLWKPNQRFNLLLSAVSNKNVIVSDPALAAQQTENGATLFGNKPGKMWTGQLGAELRADLNLKFADNKVAFLSVLDLYSNYLKTPENISVEWLSSLDLLLSKHLALSLRSDWYYDDAVLVKVGGNPDRLGKRISIRNTFFVKYNKVF